ncbi:MAG: hypothetical protein J6T94_06690 [Bacteroidaceae bacterium]|nr:hypothetical protein [Bacteroidaceae bacterium]
MRSGRKKQEGNQSASYEEGKNFFGEQISRYEERKKFFEEGKISYEEGITEDGAISDSSSKCA